MLQENLTTGADVTLDRDAVFCGDSAMAARMRSTDWSTTPLSEPERWPASLRASVTLMLGSRFPMFIAWGEKLTFLYNDAYAEILGGKHPEALARPFEHIWREIWPDISPLVDRAMAGEAVWLENLPLRMNRNGQDEDTTFTFSYSPARDDSGAVAGMFCACTETTGQVRAEASLRDLAQSLEQKVEERTAERDRMWETSPDLMVVIDFQGVLRRVNPAWTKLLGYQADELVGHHVNEFVIPDDHAATEDAYELAAKGGTPTIENRYHHKDGSVRSISWVAAPAGELTYATGRDVTAEKERETELAQAQDALRQSQKMEAVGQLTGGLAHDFNNLLTGMMGNLELLANRIGRGRYDGLERFIDAAQGAGNRAASLTQRLLAFSRRQTLDPKAADVNRLITGMEELIRRTVGPMVQMEVVGAMSLWPAMIDTGQLENAVLNLCINARDAMPDGGRLTIETANRWLDGRTGREQDLPAGQYVSVCVTDTGTGMSPETLSRAFDPFFTTKPIGQGTGLGLSMIYGFAKQSGGQVRIYSEIDQGTTVCIYLPRYAGEIDEDETLVEDSLPDTAAGRPC